MLVDNPKRFLSSFCLLRGKSFTAESYRDILASFTAKGMVHEKTRDTYFYMATILSLIRAKRGSHEYVLTPLCEKICDVMNDPKNIKTYRTYLRGLILSNPAKGDIFRQFIQFTEQPKELKDITRSFGKVPTKTLLAFCKEAGLVVQYGPKIRSVTHVQETNLENFHSALTRAYTTLKVDSERGVTVVYVPIDELRNSVSLELGMESPVSFDKFLEQVLDGPMGVSIYLHGAPPQVNSEYTGFWYKGKRYAYLSIRGIR